MSRNGNCDAKHHGNASAGTMVRSKLVFAARMCLHAVLDLYRSVLHVKQLYLLNTLPNILKKNKRRAGHERGQNEVRTRYQTRSKTTRDRPLPKSGTDRNKPAGPTQRTKQTRGRDTHREIKEHRMAHTHPRAKTTYMTNPKCLNVIHHNISLYILFHAILSYLNLTNPHKHVCCEKKKATHGRHTSKHRNNIHNLSNMLYYDAPQYAFPQGRRSSATT